MAQGLPCPLYKDKEKEKNKTIIVRSASPKILENQESRTMPPNKLV